MFFLTIAIFIFHLTTRILDPSNPLNMTHVMGIALTDYFDSC